MGNRAWRQRGARGAQAAATGSAARVGMEAPGPSDSERPSWHVRARASGRSANSAGGDPDASSSQRRRAGRIRQLTGLADEGIVGALVDVLGHVDGDTRWHSERASRYAVHLGRWMGLSRAALSLLARGTLLHDVGKLGIRDQLFLKPGRLSEEEWREMRRHPDIGYGLLTLATLLDETRTMVRQHHERWDGTGYPEGVSGGEIHLGARIISVVDTLDAMTTDRPYRPALPFDVAWDEIVECAGSQFDPGVVVALDDMGREHWRELVDRELCSARTVL